MVRHNAVDAAQRVAIVEVDILADLLRNRFRRLDYLPVDIGDVEVAIRSIGKVAGTEPDIRGGEKFHAVLGAAGDKGGSVRANDIAMHQIRAHVSGEYVADVLFRKRVAVVECAAGG